MLERLLKSAAWTVLTIVAPEWILGLTVSHLVDALESIKTSKQAAADDGVEWGLCCEEQF
jgi:hypothetical protein